MERSSVNNQEFGLFSNKHELLAGHREIAECIGKLRNGKLYGNCARLGLYDMISCLDSRSVAWMQHGMATNNC